MVRIKSSARRLNATLLLKRIVFLSDRLKSIPDFSGKAEIEAKLEAAKNRLQAASNKQQTAASMVQAAALEVHQAHEEANSVVDEWAHEVSIMSQNNPNIVYESGFDFPNTPTRQSKINPPQHLSLSESNGTGKLDASVQRVKGAKTYIVQINYDINNDKGWEQLHITTRTKSTLTPLEPGKKVWVRVAAVSAAGQSDWSDVATRIVP